MSPYVLMPNPNLIGAAVVERTERAGILQSGNIVPRTNPIRRAEEYAMLDVQSGGRLIAGFHARHPARIRRLPRAAGRILQPAARGVRANHQGLGRARDLIEVGVFTAPGVPAGPD